MKKLAFAAAAALALTWGSASGDAAETASIESRNWSFSGLFGTYDRASAQRGLQIYNEICSACHGLKYVAFRNLGDLGFSEAEVQAIASNFRIQDGPDDNGEMFMREGVPSDRFPSPFANEQAARAANNGAFPPDLSLITKARAEGADYLYALLTTYREPPADVEVPPGQYYNLAFPGHTLSMAPPLMEGLVEYADGTEATVSQMAADVTTFLTWAADPHMEERKRMGVKAMLFLIVLTGMLYAVKRKVWADVH